MTMEEVNERFPLTKYKAWRAARAAEGLPTAGGVAATATTSRPPSVRAPSIKDGSTTREGDAVETSARKDEGQIKSPKQEPTEADPSSEKQSGTPSEPNTATDADARPSTAQTQQPPGVPVTKMISTDQDMDDDDEHDDQIQTALPAEMLGDPGDSCAICIDNIEDDDDIRGLTCGHAFHAHCVDPWLTSRRASCPLCKADYYVPKPRPEGAEAAAEAERIGRRARGGNMPASPPYALMGNRHGRPRMILPGRFMTIVYSPTDRYGFPEVQRESRPNRQNQQRNRFFNFGASRQQAPPSPNTGNRNENTASSGNENANAREGFGNRLRNIRVPAPSLPSVSNVGFMNRFRRRNEANASSSNGQAPPAGEGSTPHPTPSQLEAGQGPSSHA